MTFPSLNGLLDAVIDKDRDRTRDKSLPLPPGSPELSPTSSPSPSHSEHEPTLDQPVPDTPSSASLPSPQQASLTKRQHALHELLASERAYASDLALIREVHIPLALGQTIPLPNLPITPPNSSGSSSRTLSTASDSSTTSLGPPMTPDDVKTIFGNITEIALFSDIFCQALEEALGSLVEGGQGEDHVGALFLRIIPELERPYKQYITRHPTALTHLQLLPQTPALQNYLTYTQTIASSLSHAWDLSSLLIKPVQRLLKYPLLLAAIIDETPDSHPDKENLREARKQMEEVARNVNEGRRRAEVVRDVLTSKKKSVGVGVSASVSLTKMKSLRVNPAALVKTGVKDGEKTPEEAVLVERLQKELQDIEEFAQKFAKNVVEWARTTSNVVVSLRAWALGFSRVIGLSAEQGSEAFDAFLHVVEQQLMPLCVDLEAVINERVLKELAHLLMTMNQPLKLLASMNEQEPYHYHLMNMTVTPKNRPPPSLLAASTNYLALRGQLATELPTYVALFHQGLKIFIRRLADIQTEFWNNVRDRWGGLWEMLRVEGEMNAGHEETVHVWVTRWSEVDQIIASLPVVQVGKLYHEPRSRSRGRDRDSREAAEYFTANQSLGNLAQHPYLQAPHDRSPMYTSFEPSHSRNAIYAPGKEKKMAQAANVMSMLGALEPSMPLSAAGGPYVSGPLPLATGPPNSKGRGNSDLSSASTRRNVVGKKGSDESLSQGSTARNPGPMPRTHAHRRRTTGGIGPAPEDLAEYRMMLREQEKEFGYAQMGYGYTSGFALGLPHTYEYDYGHGSGPGLTRMKSMPLPHHPQAPAPQKGGGHAREREYVDREEEEELFYRPRKHDEYSREEYEHHERKKYRERDKDHDRERGRDRGKREPPNQRHSTGKEEEKKRHSEHSQYSHKSKDEKREKDKGKDREGDKERDGRDKDKRPVSSSRKRSGSIKSITSFFTSNRDSHGDSTPPTPDRQPQFNTPSPRDSWALKPAKYICQVVHPCKPPTTGPASAPSPLAYFSFPFFTLKEGEFYEVLQEAGHPSLHPSLPLVVDEGEDCLLLCRAWDGGVGWALASFLEPVSGIE